MLSALSNVGMRMMENHELYEDYYAAYNDLCDDPTQEENEET